MKNRILLSLLALSFSVALIYYVGLLSFNIYMNTIWDKSPAETQLPANKMNHRLRKMATIYKEDGFEIPVTMNFYYPDTIVQISGELNEATKAAENWIPNNDNIDNRRWFNTWPVSHSKWKERTMSKFDTIYKVDTLINRALVTKGEDDSWRGVNVEAKFKENIFDLVQFQHFIKSTVNIKPKTTDQFFLLLFRANLIVFFFIFICYQLLKSVLILKSNFSFTINLYSRIKAIGWAILLYSILQFTLDYSLKYIYDFIAIDSSSTAANYIDDIVIYMYAYYDFPFEGFCVGLLLIIFSILMKRASEIEKDWSLTI